MERSEHTALLGSPDSPSASEAPLDSTPACDADASPDEQVLVPASAWVRITTALFVVVPLVALVTGILTLWGTGVGWSHLIPLAVGYVLTGLGITVGYHRLFTHKSFDAHPIVRGTLAVLGSMAAEGPLNWWVANHRRHHQHSDRPDDPHSPHVGDHSGVWGAIRGAFHAHLGWLFAKAAPDTSRLVPDLRADRVAMFVTNTFPLWVVLGLVIPAGLGWLIAGSWIGGVLGLIWGGLVRIFLVHHVTWSVNSICHLWGARPFRCQDQSRNNPVVGVLAFGEGWHNNHHAFPASARHGLAWWQFDLSYLVILALKGLGLAWDVRTPAPERVAAKRRSLPRP